MPLSLCSCVLVHGTAVCVCVCVCVCEEEGRRWGLKPTIEQNATVQEEEEEEEEGEVEEEEEGMFIHLMLRANLVKIKNKK